MVNPPKPAEKPKPTKAQFRDLFKLQSENNLEAKTQEPSTNDKVLSPTKNAINSLFDESRSCSVDANLSYSDPLMSNNLSL